MSTRAERFKAEAQRTGAAATAPQTAPHEPHGHVEKKAAYAREAPVESGRPSRKSTRKSANRTKTDVGEVRAEQMRENTPEAQFARNDAHSKGMRPGESR